MYPRGKPGRKSFFIGKELEGQRRREHVLLNTLYCLGNHNSSIQFPYGSGFKLCFSLPIMLKII